VHDSDVSVHGAPPAVVTDASGDVAWVADAYDSFADTLYAYCRSLVLEPAAAADALRDTFVVTAVRLDDLPGDGLLRPWLFAVARNECLRAISAGQAAVAGDFLPGVVGTDAPPAGPLPADRVATGPGSPDETSPDLMTRHAEDTRALLRAALGGLGAADRDLMIMAWHGLAITEMAFMLGTPRDAAFRAFTRASEHLEQCALALGAARSQQAACGPLNAMLYGWDGRLTPPLSSELRQHIDHCDACALARHDLQGPVVLQMSPEAMQAMAAMDGTARLTAWVTSRLREQVLAAAFDQEPGSFEHRAMVVRRAGQFRGDGFPVALLPSGATSRRRRRSALPLVLTAAGATGLAAVITIAALALSGNHSTGNLQAWDLAHPTLTTSAGDSATGAIAGRTATATPSASHTAKPTPSSPSPTRTTPPAAPKTNAAVQRALRVSTTSLTLRQGNFGGGFSGAFTLTNPSGSSVSWSVSVAGGSHVGAWPNSGRLAPGSSTTVNVYAQDHHGDGNSSAGSGGGQTVVLTIEPGNIQVSVTIP
jgi:DNA-directed RNA polymerase specialized sigma24 family protein